MNVARYEEGSDTEPVGVEWDGVHNLQVVHIDAHFECLAVGRTQAAVGSVVRPFCPAGQQALRLVNYVEWSTRRRWTRRDPCVCLRTGLYTNSNTQHPPPALTQMVKLVEQSAATLEQSAAHSPRSPALEGWSGWPEAPEFDSDVSCSKLQMSPVGDQTVSLGL